MTTYGSITGISGGESRIGGYLTEAAIQVGEIEARISRVQMLHDLAVNLQTSACNIADRLFGTYPTPCGENTLPPQPHSLLVTLDANLDVLERHLRGAMEEIGRLSKL